MGVLRGSEPLFEVGDRVAVLGLGVSGASAARLIHARGGAVYASDAFDGPGQTAAAEELRRLGIDAEIGRHDLDRILASDLVVTSPGIDPNAEVRQAVADSGLRTVAEIEVAFRNLESRVIGITGTNGKTTATALCGHLLKTTGLDATTAGNIGRPLSDVAILDAQPDWVVVELSSFQLADQETFRPDVGVLLNLAPDHLDRYPSLERYYGDKRRLFANATADCCWVINLDDGEVVEMAKDVAGHHYFASLTPHDLEGTFLGEDGWLTQRLDGQLERWTPEEQLRLVGRHNVMNALLAGLAAALAGCEAERIGQGLATFEGLPHRLQPIGVFDGVRWINDSKGTNVSAARVAIRAFQQPVIVVLGGRHKGEPYTSLLPVLKEHARAVIAFGEAAPRIVRELGDHVPLHVESGVGGVVRCAKKLAREGDVVVFSPACSSFDMFPDYKERGLAFERAVRELHEGVSAA
jgi:UDP-N-acetylmuramoylalanine--D-glutamate ligase